MTVLTAYLSLIPEKREAALELCRMQRDESLKEPGCERYDFFQNPDDPTRVVFVEEWSSRADLDRHFQQPTFGQFLEAITGLLQRPPEIRIFEATLQE